MSDTFAIIYPMEGVGKPTFVIGNRFYTTFEIKAL